MRRLALPLALLTLLLLPAQASAATGDLSFKDCIAKLATGSCTAVPSAATLEGGRDVAVSPDGKLIYVSDGDDTVFGFKRSLVDGSVTYAGCIESGSAGSCAHTPNNTLLVPTSLAFSPDGKTLYVATETSDTVVRMSVDSGGGLSFVSCVESNDALPNWGCTAQAAGMATIYRVVVSGDGNAVYVAGNRPR